MMGGVLLFVQDSSVSLVLVIVVIVMLYATLRTISESRRRARNEEQHTTPAAQPYLSSSSHPHGFEGRTATAVQTHDVPIPPAFPEDSGPVDMTLYDPEAYDETPRTNLAIVTYAFQGFNADVGPPDRDCFYDEIMLELYDRDTGHRWRTRYFVATPPGIAKLMADERWQAMSGNNHLIVLRYDVKKILDAILRQLNNAWEAPSAETEASQ